MWRENNHKTRNTKLPHPLHATCRWEGILHRIVWFELIAETHELECTKLHTFAQMKA